MNQEAIARAVEAFQALQDAVDDLAEVYEQHPELNNLQPASLERCIPMSLDEWSAELVDARDELIQNLRSPLRQYLARAFGGTAGHAFAQEIESNPCGKWTATDVTNWFVNRRAAFVPSPDQANRLAGMINDGI